MKFELSKKQEKEVKKIEKKLRRKFGSVGPIEYRFSHSSGIGVSVEIFSSQANKVYNITEYDKW